MTFFEWFYKVVIIQLVCVGIILLGVVIIKCFYKTEFARLENFYTQQILSDTKTQEVIENEI